ncbi:uncharacterized protein METZ01_LOCUS363269, partial [marine metagenome]
VADELSAVRCFQGRLTSILLFFKFPDERHSKAPLFGKRRFIDTIQKIENRLAVP